jgi:hypothetical protein
MYTNFWDILYLENYINKQTKKPTKYVKAKNFCEKHKNMYWQSWITLAIEKNKIKKSFFKRLKTYTKDHNSIYYIHVL